MTRDHEVWAIALSVERLHGANGWFFIAQQQDRLLAEGAIGGVALWRQAGVRFEALTAHQQPAAKKAQN